MVDIQNTKTIIYDKPKKGSKTSTHSQEFRKPKKKPDMADYKQESKAETEVARTPDIPETHDYPDGSQYVGTHAFNMFGEYRKHGYGIFTWADGKQYEGYWVDGR